MRLSSRPFETVTLFFILYIEHLWRQLAERNSASRGRYKLHRMRALSSHVELVETSLSLRGPHENASPHVCGARRDLSCEVAMHIMHSFSAMIVERQNCMDWVYLSV